MPSVFITGANRGIGLELTRQYAADGWKVVATCRQPEKADELNAIDDVDVYELDVTNRDHLAALARDLDEPFDVVIACAGVMGDRSGQSYGSIDYDDWEDVMQVNLFGSVKTCEAFTPHLERGEQKKLVAITSKMGSIGDASGGVTAYRTSKAALNMAMVAAAGDLKSRGIAVGVLHPGWVQTDMGGPSALITVEESATGLRQVIDGLKPADKAHFLAFDGQTIPW
ncbi:SDR family oxidoreductase [Parvularcula sp. LCG005]|uniref:SDR family oxidoreductase n=1 Tax=Parvularcula sp. LCG005 TaxID=3078805 RepID=UPI002941FA35|nr:SDR family oxidoreductase [Parvularcula sp. LCG005]WOI53420.1 SDR family oxidoreductase [Parvularcula sp. LCG005]